MKGINGPCGRHSMGKPKFAFLLLKEHPYGREMLMQILSEGFIPDLIIEEDSEIGDEEREKFLKRIGGHQIAPSIQEQANEMGIDVVSVPIHNSEEVMPHLEGMDLDLIVFGGTRIIRGEILDYPSDGVITHTLAYYLTAEALHLLHGRFSMTSQSDPPPTSVTTGLILGISS